MFFILKPLFSGLSDGKTTCIYCSQNVIFCYVSFLQTHSVYSVYTFTALQQYFLQEMSVYILTETFSRLIAASSSLVSAGLHCCMSAMLT